jgi:cobalamin synthase
MSLWNAIGHLTVLRVPPRRQVPLMYSIHYFPLIGAAVGSLCIFFFLAADGLLPNAPACLLTVLLAQFLAGWVPWRGVAEAVQGQRTYPGYGFRSDFRLDRRGAVTVAALLALKVGALAVLPHDWQVRAVFVYPILGYCARTFAFLLGPVKAAAPQGVGSLLLRRRVRAGYLAGALLFLVFLFPLRLALPLLMAGGLLLGWTLKARKGALTFQAASVASEVAENLFLVAIAVASLYLL